MSVFPFIEAEEVEQGNVAKACQLLEVSQSAFYEWHKHLPPTRRLADDDFLIRRLDRTVRHPLPALAQVEWPRRSVPSRPRPTSTSWVHEGYTDGADLGTPVCAHSRGRERRPRRYWRAAHNKASAAPMSNVGPSTAVGTQYFP